ncbi:MAG TPA: ATP-binding protein, partial [Polyangia bacterium]|nr:ATP-binding protein [Polyangia bacterium]
MRTFARIAVILAALAGVLGVSVTSALREQQQLLDQFTVTTREQVHASAGVLSARLDQLDQDTRTLTDVVDRSAGSKEPAVERRIWASAFQALAVVVPQYRTISLFSAEGTLDVQAVDPTESAATVQALLPFNRSLAAQVSRTRDRALGKPAARLGERAFLLYGLPVRNGGAIVVASDVAIFLTATTWTPPPTARLFVTDPAGTIWSGCETAAGCRVDPADPVHHYLRTASADESVRKYLRSIGEGMTMIGPHAAQTLGMGRAPAVLISERVQRPTGTWTVTWLASSRPIVARERSLLIRLILTAIGTALAVAGVGAVMLRQQRKAVALEGQLRYAQALATARETSESIVENAPLGVLGVSADGRVVLANRFLTDRLGPIRLGVPVGEAFSGEGIEWIRDLEPHVRGALPLPEAQPVTTKSQQFHVRIVPVRDSALGVRMFVLAEDRSQLRALEDQLVRAEKLVTVGVLSAGIAHEIGSPLAVIRGRAEHVLRYVDAGPRADDLRIIIKHIDNISSTIRQLLDFSRRQPIAQRAVALESSIERARGLLQWKLDARKLTLAVHLDADLPTLAADPDQLQQVLVNLLLNACDASEPGQEIALRASATRDGPVRIELQDRGCGIAPEHLHAVFDPFFTTKKRGEGTGLGLPIAASIV